jgi:hypothetical protein
MMGCLADNYSLNIFVMYVVRALKHTALRATVPYRIRDVETAGRSKAREIAIFLAEP